jgi:hypothetical protein
MPTVDELKDKLKTKKFKKVSYRPWDMEQNPTVEEVKLSTLAQQSEADPNSKKKETLSYSPWSSQSEGAKSFRLLHGTQRNIMIFVCNKISHEDEEFSYTFPFPISELVEYTHSTTASIQGSLYQLKKKNLISTYENKPGRGGFASYKISKEFCNYIRQNIDFFSGRR